VDLVVRVLAALCAFNLALFVHEAGHFMAARLTRMTVYEFSMFIGRPLLLWFRRGDTQYSLRSWPFACYVRIAGMEPEDDHPQGFYKRSRLAQAFVLFSGSAMNFLLAVAIFIFIGVVIGKPVDVTNTIDRVMPGSPAAQIGLMPGDRLVGYKGKAHFRLVEIQKFIQAHPEESIPLEIERNGRRLSLDITPERKSVPEMRDDKLVYRQIGRIGVGFRMRLEHMGIGESIVAGIRDAYRMIQLTVTYLVGLILGKMPLAVAGPVGVAHILYTEAQAGWLSFLSTFAALTVALGAAQLLPIPLADGGRLAIVAVEAIRRKPFDKRKEAVVHLVGFALLLVLMVVITYKDIERIITGGG